MILLSICMPTFNRGSIMTAQVRSLLQKMPARLHGRFEVVISENHSTDSTHRLLQEAFGHLSEVRICRPEQHLGTAEENLCFAVSQCKGEFVWSLGDDDAIEPDSFETLAQMLEANDHDYLIFNSRLVSWEGVVKKPVSVECFAPILNMKLLDFIRIAGFWYTPAMMSGSIFRRSAADTKLLEQILSKGKIYAHVIWLIACFHDKRFGFVNQPLVANRENPYRTVEDDKHWEKLQQRQGIFDGAIWSVGFFRLVDVLVNKKILERRFLREVVDRGPFHRFFFIEVVLGHFLRGLDADIKGTGMKIPEADLAYFNEWALDLWGNNIVLISTLDKILELRRSGLAIDPGLGAELNHILAGLRMHGWFENFHKYDAYGFGVYRHGSRWFAIRHGCVASARPLLEALDFEPYEDMLGVSDTEGDIVNWVKSQPRHLPNQSMMVIERERAVSFDSHRIAQELRAKHSWSPREWYRIVRAINHVAKRGIKRRLGFRV